MKKELAGGWQKRFKLIAIRYLSGNFVFDFLSVFPFLFGKLATGGDDITYREQLEMPIMQFFAYLRLLRITQLPKILNASTVYAQMLMNKFPSYRQLIFNSKQIFSLVLFLLLSLHLSAVINISQGTAANSWITLDADGRPLDQTSFELYVDQMYFITTTTTTVGYGDFGAA